MDCQLVTIGNSLVFGQSRVLSRRQGQPTSPKAVAVSFLISFRETDVWRREYATTTHNSPFYKICPWKCASEHVKNNNSCQIYYHYYF